MVLSPSRRTTEPGPSIEFFINGVQDDFAPSRVLPPSPLSFSLLHPSLSFSLVRLSSSPIFIHPSLPSRLPRPRSVLIPEMYTKTELLFARIVARPSSHDSARNSVSRSDICRVSPITSHRVHLALVNFTAKMRRRAKSAVNNRRLSTGDAHTSHRLFQKTKVKGIRRRFFSGDATRRARVSRALAPLSSPVYRRDLCPPREKRSHLTAEYLSLFHPFVLADSRRLRRLSRPAPPTHTTAVRCLNKPRDVSVRSYRIRSHFVAETSDRKFAFARPATTTRDYR